MFKIRELYRAHADLLRDYPPLAERMAELTELLSKADRVIEITEKLGVPDSVLSEDDLKFLRENHSAFGARAKEAIVARITARLKSEAKLLPGYPPIRVIANGHGPTVAANWAWAGQGLVSYCLVGVDRSRHLNSPAEADQYGLLPYRYEDHTRAGGSRLVAPPEGANRVFVTVWAVVELGWTTVYGPPLHLGPATLNA